MSMGRTDFKLGVSGLVVGAEQPDKTPRIIHCPLYSDRAPDTRHTDKAVVDQCPVAGK